ncbi:hypothetical protein ASF49_01665 [Methylobacterium sp. Leaf104]|uniref:esterase/lipase family protein n=1 Tax=Methylobacterium TaxID=407 RepID=UPI000712EB10|nr:MULTISPECIES: hypothetical protein [Methylobacterium]KQP42580.1 hypothetical protein ASF49_01665 [Methylobacterium sp. Leaf104]MCI9878871.1 hypothetical protein [Methylobacterium goesingense]
MEAVIFVPGILGSELHDDQGTVWPPSVLEVVQGYRRMDRLLGDGVQPGGPIRNVACKLIYEHILGDLSLITAGHSGAPVRGLHPFGYDWRKDIRKSASSLADLIEGIPPGEREGIHIVAHSMGCLVSRMLLESGSFESREWFPQIRSLIALAGPHQGAPVAFVRAIGLEGSMGLAPSDIQRMAADPRYPALYQLFPPPGENVVWDVRAGRVDPVDIYAPEISERFGLCAANMTCAKDAHAILVRQAKPEHVRYLYLAGSGLDTCLRVDAVGEHRSRISGGDAGDGTVPLWSAVRGDVRHHVAPGEHSEIFRNTEIRDLMYRALGARMPYTPFSTKDGKPLLRVVPARASFSPGEDIELMLVLDQRSARVDGDLAIEFTPDITAQPFSRSGTQHLTWNGARTSGLMFLLDPGSAPGHYRISFSGTHETTGDGMAVFAVTVV